MMLFWHFTVLSSSEQLMRGSSRGASRMGNNRVRSPNQISIIIIDVVVAREFRWVFPVQAFRRRFRSWFCTPWQGSLLSLNVTAGNEVMLSPPIHAIQPQLLLFSANTISNPFKKRSMKLCYQVQVCLSVTKVASIKAQHNIKLVQPQLRFPFSFDCGLLSFQTVCFKYNMVARSCRSLWGVHWRCRTFKRRERGAWKDVWLAVKNEKTHPIDRGLGRGIEAKPPERLKAVVKSVSWPKMVGYKTPFEVVRLYDVALHMLLHVTPYCKCIFRCFSENMRRGNVDQNGAAIL